jgi:hypothetical protein
MQTQDSSVSVVTRLQAGVILDSLSDKEADLIYSSPERLWDQPSFLRNRCRELLPWIGRILRRNCLLKHGNEGKIRGMIEMTGRRGRRGKQLPDDLKEKRGY